MSDELSELRAQVARLEDVNRELLQKNSELTTEFLCIEEENQELRDSEWKTTHCVARFLNTCRDLKIPQNIHSQFQKDLSELLNQVFDGEDLRAWL